MRHVEVVDVDGAGWRRLVCARDGSRDVPDCGRFGHPGGAEGALDVAVYEGEVGRGGVGGEEEGGLVEFGFEVSAVAAAGFVAAGYEDEPFLGG